MEPEPRGAPCVERHRSGDGQQVAPSAILALDLWPAEGNVTPGKEAAAWPGAYDIAVRIDLIAIGRHPPGPDGICSETPRPLQLLCGVFRHRRPFPLQFDVVITAFRLSPH